jgi:hypothetical protein
MIQHFKKTTIMIKTKDLCFTSYSDKFFNINFIYKNSLKLKKYYFGKKIIFNSL